jgi:ketosteroid isomerase-like protein
MERSDQVRAAVERLFERFPTADLEGFDASIAADPESFVIGTQRWTSGRDEWLGNFRFLVDNGLVVPDGSGVRLEAGDVRAFAEGGLGWAVAWTTFVFAEGKRLPSRCTAVLRREDGEWKIVHAHFSVAVPDELALEHVDAWLQQLGEVPA